MTPSGFVTGLDFAAVLSLGMAARVNMPLLAEMLPVVEAALLKNANQEDGNGEA